MHKQRYLGLLLGIGVLLVTACTPVAPPSQADVESETAASVEEAPAAGPREGGTLTILYWQAASLPNPYLSGGGKDVDAAAITLEPLANLNEAGEFALKLAAEVPTLENGGISADLTTITWQLKEGLLWSDGTPVTAEDAVFTWEYCTHPDTGCASFTFYEGVENIEAVDDLTIKITFDSPTPYPYTPFVTARSPIIQKAQFANCIGTAAQECSEQNLMPHGTGPYKIVDFKVNDVVTYESNEHYRDADKPFFSTVVFKGGGDAASAARAVLQTGEADYAWNLQVEPDILAEMEADGNGKIVVAFAGLVERLLLNQTNPDPALGDRRSEWTPDDPNPHPFLTHPAVYQALSMAIDRNVIAGQLYGFAGRPTCNIIPGPPAYVSTANDDCLVQDIAGANQLLDDAGIIDTDGDGIRELEGVPLKILYQTSTNAVRQKTQALIKQWWAEIGVDTELKNIDAAVYFGGDPNSPDTYGKFYADVEMYTDGPPIDPQLHLATLLCSEIAGRDNNWLGNNVPRGCNQGFDALFDELSETPVGERRVELVKQMNDIHVQNGYQIPLVFRGFASAHVNSLLGVQINGWDTEMWNIADWSRAE